MKSILIFSCSLLLVSVNALAAQDLQCIADHRPADGNMVSVTFQQQINGTYDIFYGAAGGGFGPGHTATPATEKQIASGLKCLVSKLDPRILQCSNDSFSTFLSSSVVNRSEMVVLGMGHVTHKMKESVEIEIQTPEFKREVLSFDSAECKVE